jgi:hypothetical protein
MASPLPATWERVVLLPHARTKPASARPNDRRTGRVTGMNPGHSSRQHPTQSNGTARAIVVTMQWHDAELAMKVARRSVERWLATGHEDAPSPAAIMHAYHTHTALREAARVLIMLIDIFGVEAAALITTPAHGTDIPFPRR